MNADSKEAAFQQDIIDQMVAGGWMLGDPAKYDRKLALYTEDCLQYVKTTQPKIWEKYEKLYPADPEQAFIDKLASQLAKADPQASAKHLRTYGTLGVLRHELRDKSASFKMCQFKPEHGLNPDTQMMYEGNILRIVPELVYSPYATAAELAETGKQAKKCRIDLVLFVNGIPVVTMELKSEFKQAVENAIRQYQKTRLPKDPDTNKPEPLLTFKRGALVHFAVSQYQAAMTTRLEGTETRFLPFNKGTKEGGAGNDIPQDVDEYATSYLWNEVLAPANLLQIIGRFVHLEINTEEDWEGRKTKKESLIFPRYHQWDLVRKLIQGSRDEGPGHKYLAQHSAGSGKSNSIAWTAHQLSSLYNDAGEKVFHSVIVVTDRTVLDAQLQDTIYQFEHADPTFIANAEGEMKEAKKELDALGIFKADLVSFTRYYEFMSQIVDYDSTDLEKLSLYARHLAPLLREEAPQDDPIDLTVVALSHYRLSKIKQQDLMLVKEGGQGLQGGTDLGKGKAKSKKEEWLSQIIDRLNELFVTDGLSDSDLINHAYAVRDKLSENERIMHQIFKNSAEQALLGDFAEATDEAVMESGEANQNLMMQYLNSPELQAKFQRVVFDMLLAKGA